MHSIRLVAAEMLSPGVRLLTFEPTDSFSFVPGQWVSLRIPLPNQELIIRSYSIASAPRADGRFEIAVTRVENGPASTWLHEIAVGTELTMSHAQGFFTLGMVTRPVLFVGTGTGVAPLRSMLHGAIASNALEDVSTVLLFGVRNTQDLLFRSEFEHYAQSLSNFRFEPTLSRPEPNWNGRRGYVQTHLEEIVRSLGGQCDVYICGLNKMIREVRRTLKDQLGFTRELIHSERYD